MEETKIESAEIEDQANGFKGWFQDNLRVIVSVIVVIIIAGGIYSYSRRSENIINENLALLEEKENTETEITKDESKDENENENVVVEEKKEEQKNEVVEEKSEEIVSTENSSKETENSFVEKAEKGNGSTHLARKALAHYLEKNPDSQLTKEHKIYIEDYLRKNINNKGHLTVGATLEFSKDLIKNSIEQSKKLNDLQLKNLQKYSALVSNL